MPNFYSILILLLFLSTCLAGPTIIITGSAEQNAAKLEFLGRYVPQSVLKNDQTTESKTLIYNRKNIYDSLIEDSESIQQIGGVSLERNISTIAITNDAFEEFSAGELTVLSSLLKTDRALFVIEFGKTLKNSLVLLEIADCWAKSSVESQTANTVYFCGKKADVIPFEIINEWIPIVKHASPTVSSFFFVSATSKKYRVDKKKMEEELEDEIQDIVEESMKTVEKNKKDSEDDDDDGNEFDNKHDPKRDHRLHCKYRKSCYDTGKRGLIEPYDISFDHIFHFWRAPVSQQHHLPKTVDADQDGVPDSEDDDVNLADRKLVCKYRTSCYKEHDIPLSDKQQERERSFMTAKLQAPQGKKRTLKDIAQKAVSGVKEKEEEAKNRPVPKSLIVEKKLQEIENQLQKKLDCKYRKSCYETGKLPDIEESSFTIPFFSLTSDNDDDDDDKEEQKPFGEMEDLEKKHYCKYRKSCYKTGEKPDIESEISIESFHDILEMPDIVETRKLTLQERCKYRKSCYETGILPDLSRDDEHIEKVINKEVSSVVPSTVQDLKTLCKYRKSCYQEISESSSADIVQTIRKRRLIEKEVRKRRTRRHRRLHKRRAMMTRYGMTSGSASKYDKVEKTQKELQDIADAREHRKDAPAPKSVKLHGKKKTIKNGEDIAEQAIVEAVSVQPEEENEESEESEPEITKPRKGKRSLKKVREQPEPALEDIYESEEEQEREPPKKSKKSSKKVKEAEPEPELEDDDQEPETVPVPEPVRKPKKSLKKSKEANLDDVKTESAPIPVPVIKIIKKEFKKDEEQKQNNDNDDDDDNDEQKTSAQLQNHPPKGSEGDDDEDNGNEFDNQHDPKRDHRLHCKYRKTCYETGKRGLIEPYDFSLWHIVHFWAAPPSQQHHNYGKQKDSDGDGVPDVEDKDAAMADRKLSCKYRPSCYEKYDIPVGEKILEREQKRSSESTKNNEKDDDDDEEDRKVNLNAADRRLECKYRRSCYDSGVLPNIRQWSDAPTLSETIEYSSKNLKMQKCKYRKSCYEAAGITDKDNDADKEDLKAPLVQEKLKPVQSSSTERHHSKHGKKKHQEPEDSDEDNDEKEEQKEKQKKNKEEKKEKSKIHEQSDKETLEQEGKEISLSVAEKSWCKYRKSCYSSVEPKAAKQDHSGSMARRAGSGQKCHVYYLSCREAMGLPPKEKAPMGPNGKRLCRKVKKDN